MIRNFTPVDSEGSFYVLYSVSLADILKLATLKWGDVSLEDVKLEAQYIHTRCLDYDLYDANDFDNYIVVSLKN